MKITNKFNLPETIVNFSKMDNYDAGKSNVTVTQLIDSPRVVQLRKKHYKEMEQDVGEMLWMLMGVAMHHILEQSVAKDTVTEERLFTKLNGWVISGQIDSQIIGADGVTLGDYKTTSAWAVMNDKPDWERQLNLYSWLVRKVKGLPTKQLVIYAIIRDWARRDLGKEGYPQAPMVVVQVPLWSEEEQDRYVEERLNLHAHADSADLFGEELPPCSDEERWQSETRYAVKKEGNKRATFVAATKEEATDYIRTADDSSIRPSKKEWVIEERKGEPKRCTNNYCRCAPFCEQFINEVKDEAV